MAKMNDPKYTAVSALLKEMYALIWDATEASPSNAVKQLTAEVLLSLTFGFASGSVAASTLTGNLTLTDADVAIQFVDPNGSDRTVTFPTAGADNHPFILVHSGSANTLTCDDDAATALSAGDARLFIPDGSSRYFVLSGGGSSTGGGGIYPAFVRLSVVSGDPNPNSSLAAQTAVYAMPHKGDTYPQWNGSAFAAQSFTEQTLTLNAAHLSGTVYDVYLWKDGSTQRVVTGPAWASGTSRGTGAGTAEIDIANGVMVNKNSMTVRNGANTYSMSAGYGTLIGTIVMSANGQVDWTPVFRGLWNKYNQLPAGLFTCPGYSDDNAATSYNTTGTTWEEANGGTGSRVKWVQGEVQNSDVGLTTLIRAGTSSSAFCGIGLDSIIQADVSGNYNSTSAGTVSLAANNKGLLSIGYHYASLLMCHSGASPATLYADGGRRGGEAVDSPETFMSATVMM